jgi:hypothetical protein
MAKRICDIINPGSLVSSAFYCYVSLKGQQAEILRFTNYIAWCRWPADQHIPKLTAPQLRSKSASYAAAVPRLRGIKMTTTLERCDLDRQ